MLLYGHHAKGIGVQEGFRSENLHVIYNSLDYAAQTAARDTVTEADLAKMRASLFAQPQLPLLICTGRLVPYRRLHVLLDTMQRLKRDQFPVNLLLVGDGPERGALECQAKRDGLNLKIFGACYDESVLSRLLMAADLTVVPGRVGLTATHSMTYGTPVLIHDNPNDQGPEWESVIPGYNGAYYSHADETDLVRAIRDWFKTAPPRAQVRKQCHEVIDLFYNPASQARRIERALDGAPADDSDWLAFCREHSQSLGVL